MAPLPTLGLSVVAIDYQGGETIWWSGSPRPWERPQNVSFKTRRGEGFSEATVTLSRDIRYDYVDLGLLNEIVVVGDDSTILYEGRINGTPRTWESAGQQSFTVSTVGHMASAQDRPFSERYIDQRLDQWGEISVTQKVSEIGAGYAFVAGPQQMPDVTTGAPSLRLGWDGAWALPNGARSWAMYDAGSGVALGSIYYAWKRESGNVGTSSPWTLAAILSNDDLRSSTDGTNFIGAGPGTGTLTATTTDRRFAFVKLGYEPGTAGTDGAAYGALFTCLAEYGTHGLTTRSAGTATSPPALWLSDILKNVAQRFCPKLDTSGIQENQTLVYQAAWDDTTPFQAWQELNSFTLWEMAVWENKQLCYYPADLTDYDWEVRLSDPGVSTTLQGFDGTELRNGIVVVYTDAATGQTKRLYPTDYAELRDDSPDNPANLWGLQKWGPEPFTVPVPCDQSMALSFGRAKLAELNAPKELGTITVKGHVRDRAGHWQPCSHIRAGQTVAITDFPNSRPRLIGETDYSDDGYQMNLSTDGPAQTLEAFFDRLASRRLNLG